MNNKLVHELMKEGRKEWRIDGKLHRDDGPAVIYSDGGCKEWWLNGLRHCVRGPAVIHANGGEEWWLDGQRHRVDGPAVVYPNGSEEWWVSGEFHRDVGPSVRYVCGYEVWHRHGQLHCTRGPALVHACGYWHAGGVCLDKFNSILGSKQTEKSPYFVGGHQFTEDEFYRYVDILSGEVLIPPGKQLRHKM